MYFSIHVLKHLCSLSLRLLPGSGTQCSKQFSLIFVIKYFALIRLLCCVIAFCSFVLVSVDELLELEGVVPSILVEEKPPEGNAEGVSDGETVEDELLSFDLSLLEDEEPPPNQPPKAMMW